MKKWQAGRPKSTPQPKGHLGHPNPPSKRTPGSRPGHAQPGDRQQIAWLRSDEPARSKCDARQLIDFVQPLPGMMPYACYRPGVAVGMVSANVRTSAAEAANQGIPIVRHSSLPIIRAEPVLIPRLRIAAWP